MRAFAADVNNDIHVGGRFTGDSLNDRSLYYAVGPQLAVPVDDDDSLPDDGGDTGEILSITIGRG